MSRACPFCQAPVRAAAPQPGRFRAQCRRCGELLAVTVPPDPAAAWQVCPATARTQARPSPAMTGHTGGSAVLTRLGVEAATPPPSDPSGCDTPPPRRGPAAGSVPDDAPARDGAPPGLPGYLLERTLGYGGMGTVYLARQLSLDRPVALKVMSRKWSDDPVFVARFTREAFAAALLNHSNVVQIYDIGEAGGSRYFSMEYVPGRTLAEHVRNEGKLDCETAVGYVLQAARGLKHAHDRGMIHRDVKPDNLLLNDEGVVKVADLGLVKTPATSGSDDRLAGPLSGLHRLPAAITGTRVALGTPAYMAPEQCRDAATVDHRADIYSLGCTLYVLVTGRPPFDGTTAVELMTKHAYEPIVPPEHIVTRVPKELSAVILKMMAKDAGERFASMGEVIRTLEQWLGVHHAGTFSPRDDQIDQLERHVREFHEAPTAVLKSRVVTGVISACLLAAVLLTFFGKLGWAFGLAGMVLQAALAYFVLNGVANKTYFFRRVRRFALSLGAWDWALGAAGLGLFALLLWLLNLLTLWAGFGFLGFGFAFALRVGLDRAIEAERREPLDACARHLRRMRLHGLDEEDLRQFVAKYAGRHWEEFFESLFGFEAKLQARALLLRGGSAGVREKFAAWREPILAGIDRMEKARQEATERAMLGRVEQARLEAAGVSAHAAQEQAAATAAELVEQAHAIRHADARRRKAVTMGGGGGATHLAFRGPERAAREAGVPNLGQLLAQHVAETAPRPRPAPRDPLRFAATLVVGPHVRTALAGVLLAACALWGVQNRVVSAALSDGDAATYRPLELPGVPPGYTSWADSVNVGWAGVLLLVSLLFRGNRMAAMVLLGAAVCVLGHRLGIRTVEPVRDTHVALMLGSVFALAGYRVARG